MLLLGIATVWSLSPTAETRGLAAGSVARLLVSGSTRSIEGSAFLAHAEPQGDASVYYFITAAQLLDTAELGERRVDALSLRFDFANGSTIDATGAQAAFAGSLHPGVAVIRAVAPELPLAPIPLSFEAPRVGQTFAVHDFRGGRLTAQVRFRTTRLLLGDRTSTDVSGLIGAPALIEGRAFGFVTECSTTRVPTVALLSASRSFLSRVIPMLSAVPTADERERLDPCRPV